MQRTWRLGLALPSFVEDPAVPIAVAGAAERAGLDGVFAYEHMFRRGVGGQRRPSQDLWATLGAMAASTERVAIGSLVARATLRPAAVIAHGFATLQRISRGRAIAVIGAGDRESRVENEEFGLDFGSLDARVDQLEAALDATRRVGVPTWVGGTHRRVLAATERADGWNRWGGSVEQFESEAAAVRGANPTATLTWGGLVVVAPTDEGAFVKAERLGASIGTIVGSPRTLARSIAPYVAAGATWVVLAPVDSSDPDNADLLAAVPAL
jgi:alkanesulfonate monooxygenase SsuD/methylene tetrahydromethanopterin reductase-like flavin-dependent oxidoreductase (luciferase family)